MQKCTKKPSRICAAHRVENSQVTRVNLAASPSRIERLAEADRRSISAVAELLLNAALKARGQQTAEAR